MLQDQVNAKKTSTPPHQYLDPVLQHFGPRPIHRLEFHLVFRSSGLHHTHFPLPPRPADLILIIAPLQIVHVRLGGMPLLVSNI
jgi:hypothetical protein